MSAPSLVIRVAANLAELKANLKEGGEQVDAVRSQLQRMANSYDPTTLIARAGATAAAIQQVGGVSMLSADQMSQANRVIESGIAAYERLGREAPQGMRDLAEATKQVEQSAEHSASTVGVLEASFGRLAATFAAGALIDRGVQSLFDFGRQAFESADKIVNLSEKTGLSIEAIQRMGYVAGQTGTTMDDFGRAVFKLGARLAGDDTSVSEAVTKLHLNLAALQQMRPEEQFDAITKALAAMESPQERNRLALDLFGKSVADIIPAIVEHYDQLKDHATVASDAQIKAVEAAGDKLDDWKNRILVNSVGVIAFFLNLAQAAREDEANMQHWVETGKLMPIILPEIAKTAHDAAAGLNKMALSTADVAKLQAELNANAGIYESRLRVAQEQVDGLTAEELEQIKAAKALGVTNEELAHVFGLSSDAAHLLQDRLKEDADAAKQAADFMSMTRDQAAKLASVVKGDGIPANEDWADSADAAAKKAKELAEKLAGVHDYARNLSVVNKAATLTLADLSMEFGELGKNGEIAFSTLASAEAAFDAGLDASKIKVRSLSGELETLAEAQKRFNQGGTFTYDLTTVEGVEQYREMNKGMDIAWSDEQIIEFAKKGGTLQQLMQMGIIHMRKFAEGGTNLAGGPAIVGERGPELVYLPSGSTVVPNQSISSSIGGTSVQIAAGAVVINYPIMNDPRAGRQIAALVGDAVMARLRNIGTRLPTNA